MRTGHLLEKLIRGHLGIAGRVGEVPPDVDSDLPLEHAVPVTEIRREGSGGEEMNDSTLLKR